MNNVFAMSRVERIGNLDAVLQNEFGLEGMIADLIGERLAHQQFHHDKLLAIMFFDLIDGADVGMVEGGGRAGLAQEARRNFRAALETIGQHLDGDAASQAQIFRFVNYSHSA